MPHPTSAIQLLEQTYGPGSEPAVISVPGRVNLIGEHIDYHNLPVLPMAIQRRVYVAFRPRPDRRIRAVSTGSFGPREFEWTTQLEPSAAGDWVNYVKAAAQAVSWKWSAERGIDAAVVSDLPPAAGLSSSSAVLTGFTLALLRANAVNAGFEELMDVLPEGEYFVGTRGGGMDHAAVLASRAGHALLIRFAPISAEPVPIPPGWSFLVAHSMSVAEKSGAVRAEYNARKTAGLSALKKMGFESFRDAVPEYVHGDLTQRASDELAGDEFGAFIHVVSEGSRVEDAVDIMRAGDAKSFGMLLNTAHESASGLLRISTGALDRLAAVARDSGALGARLTGAGFGGCAIVFCRAEDRDRVREGLVRGYYAGRPDFDPEQHLISAEPSDGALYV